MMKIRTLLLLLFLSSLNISAQKFEGLALTPQMGWNSWNKFGTGINEQMVKEMADALIRLQPYSLGRRMDGHGT